MIAANAQSEMREVIKTALRDRGVRQRELAEHLNVSLAGLSNRLNGQQWMTRLEAERTADFLEMTLDEVVGRSTFKGEAAAATPAQLIDPPNATTGGMCCTCGQMALISVNKPLDVEEGAYRANGRMLVRDRCPQCEDETTFAVLRRNRAYRDYVEGEDTGWISPAAQRLHRELTDLMARIRSFGVDVRTIEVNDRRQERWIKSGEPPIVEVEFDQSKSQWRIEYNAAMPHDLLLTHLRRVWKAIATDGVESDEWGSINIYQGAVWSLKAGSSYYSEYAEQVIQEVRHFAPIVRRGVVADLLDEVER